MITNLEGKKITLVTDAEAENYTAFGKVRYTARGEDPEGNWYRVSWLTTDEWDEAQCDEDGDPSDSWRWDESNACDWDNPESVILL